PGETQLLDLEFPLTSVASYDDSGASGHKSAWVLQPGTYEILVGTDVRTAEPVGRHEVPELRVVEQLEEACAVDPAHRFERMTVARDGEAIRIGWEQVSTRTVALKQRIESGLPADSRPTGDRGISLD